MLLYVLSFGVVIGQYSVIGILQFAILVENCCFGCVYDHKSVMSLVWFVHSVAKNLWKYGEVRLYDMLN